MYKLSIFELKFWWKGHELTRRIIPKNEVSLAITNPDLIFAGDQICFILNGCDDNDVVKVRDECVLEGGEMS